jgi:mono/diheme cytochrome c family protein
VVEREAAQRTRAEGFEEQFDANGVLIFDKANGARAYSMNCAGCHGDDGRKIHFTDSTSLQGLGQSSTNNVRRFWQIINFGDAERGMKAFEKEASFHDLLDITGFAQTLN